MAISESELLTLAEASKVLRVKVSTLRSWRLKGTLPFRKIGGKILLHSKDVQSFIEQSTIPAKEVSRG
jgi:excisionase family DNA binding protein